MLTLQKLLELPRLRILVVCAERHASMHISRARLLLGQQHHFSYRQFGHPSNGVNCHLVLVVADDEFHREPVPVQLELIQAASSGKPCCLVTGKTTTELMSGMSQMRSTQRWQYWPNREDAHANLAELLHLQPMTAATASH